MSRPTLLSIGVDHVRFVRASKRFLLATTCLAAVLIVPRGSNGQESETGTIEFARDIAPIFAANCLDCHGPDEQESALRLDQSTALAGGDSGEPLIVAGEPDVRLVVAWTTNAPHQGQRDPARLVSDRGNAWLAPGAAALCMSAPGEVALRLETRGSGRYAYQIFKRR